MVLTPPWPIEELMGCSGATTAGSRKPDRFRLVHAFTKLPGSCDPFLRTAC